VPPAIAHFALPPARDPLPPSRAAMDVAAYVTALLDAAGQLPFPVSPALAHRLAEHQALVEKWAQRINLTTVTDPQEAAVKHGLDCLLFGALIPDGDTGVTVDVGSGGGFPGLVLALARPELPLILLEPIRKRTSFLRTAAAQLGLDNVQVVDGRLEAQPDGKRFWPVPRIVSRATIPPLELVAPAAAHLAPGGQLVLTAGAGAPEVSALAEAGRAVGLVHVERRSFALPGGLTRILDRLEKVA
jgi:16S rRNA (guanine527-N7)-methyltransferase